MGGSPETRRGGLGPPHLQTQCSHDWFVRLQPPLPHLQTRCSHDGFQTKCSFKALCVQIERGGWGGGQPPPHLQTQCSHHASEKRLYGLKCVAALRKPGGGWGGRSPPRAPPPHLQTRCSAGMMGSYDLNPPHLQTRCSHDGFQKTYVF